MKPSISTAKLQVMGWSILIKLESCEATAAPTKFRTGPLITSITVPKSIATFLRVHIKIFNMQLKVMHHRCILAHCIALRVFPHDRLYFVQTSNPCPSVTISTMLESHYVHGLTSTRNKPIPQHIVIGKNA